MITKRLAEFILRRVATLEIFTQIARDTGLSEKTVRDVFVKKFETWDRNRGLELPVRLGIDEVVTKGKPITVLVDATRTKARVIDVLPDKKISTVSKRLAMAPNFNAVQVVSMACCDEFRDAVRGTLRNAVIVADRFHVGKKIEECFDEVRLRIWRELKTYYFHQEMKNLKWLGSELDQKDIKKHAMKKATGLITNDRERIKRERFVLFERAELCRWKRE